jgi:CDP-glucose 4,6-dehydratase
MMSFDKVFSGTRVLVTGHTGFKGAWLVKWLSELGASVWGISNEEYAFPSLFRVLSLDDYLEEDIRCDVRNFPEFKKNILKINPDFIFHLAAQPIVSESYADPIGTYTTNVLGSLHVLDAIRYLKNEVVVVMITSDKVYENVEWEWGYREIDTLGGSDPYSASKAMAEIGISAHYRSFLANNDLVKVGVGRAGNVIGGGDWAANRVVPDAMRAWSNKKPVILRNPYSTRPWQHVMEPLGGYLVLASWLKQEIKQASLPIYNFGPRGEQNSSVGELVDIMTKFWPDRIVTTVPQQISGKEAGLLKLNCDRALRDLNWKSQLSLKECAALTVEWYRTFYENPSSIESLTQRQIQDYQARLVEAIGGFEP